MKRLQDQTLYEVLEVAPDAPAFQIEEAYTRAKALYGPGSLATYTLMDPDEAEALNARIEEAGRVLLDPEARARYDAALAEGTPPAPAAPPPAAAAAPVPPALSLERLVFGDDDVETEPEAEPEVAAAPAPEPAPAPEVGVAPVSASEAAVAPEPAPAPEAALQSAPEAKPEPAPEAKPEPAEERKAEPAAEQKPEAKPEPQPAADSAPAPIPLATPIPLTAPVPTAVERVAPAARLLASAAAAAGRGDAVAPPRTPIPLVNEVRPPPAPAQPPPPRETPVVVPDGAPWTGEVLRQIREARGISLQTLAQRTKVTRHHIENIEADRFDRLPAPVYLRGILMSVARELRLDGQKVAKSYLERAQRTPSADGGLPIPKW